MIFINTVTNKFPIHEGDIRLLYPSMGSEFVLPLEYAIVEIDETEIVNKTVNEKIVTLPVELNNGKYIQKLTVVPLNKLEIEQRLAERTLQNQMLHTYLSGGIPNVIG